MSGIVGIVNLDGAPIDRPLLHSLTDELKRRGSDAEAVWIDGHVGFGHALFRTTDESENEHQPATLDGEVWITADARVDGRTELARELIASRHSSSERSSDLATATDDELLLRSYHAWGDRCVEHLIGDFAFAIWDGRRRRLLCARDQLGAKPFFFAIAGSCLIFASSVDCMRRHPGVPDALNDLAIADFLLWGYNRDLDTTVFESIRRLPAGHTLSWAGTRPQVTRYWELLPPAETWYRQPADYVERFNDLLRSAVSDRLRTDHVGVLMSGGIDSPMVAATAKDALSRRGQRNNLRAHTIVYETLIPDDERRFAGAAAHTLDIPIDYHVADRYPLFAGWDDVGWTTPEPSSDPCPKLDVDVMRAVASHSRVALTGYDGDALCKRLLPTHLRGLLESLRLKRALSEAAWFILAQRALPPIGLRTRLHQHKQRRDPMSGFPPWLDPGLIARLDLRERWQRVTGPRCLGRPFRADAIELLTGPAVSSLFDSCDPAFTGAPVALRHPLLDIRIVSYVLSLPPIPWCVNKTILRQAARQWVPASIWRRPKTPLADDPAEARLRQLGASATRRVRPSPTLARYVIPEALPPLQADANGLTWNLLWVLCLDHWLLRHELAC